MSPKPSREEVIELTDVVEEGNFVPEPVEEVEPSAEAGREGLDKELDDLFADFETEEPVAQEISQESPKGSLDFDSIFDDNDSMDADADVSGGGLSEDGEDPFDLDDMFAEDAQSASAAEESSPAPDESMELEEELDIDMDLSGFDEEEDDLEGIEPLEEIELEEITPEKDQEEIFEPAFQEEEIEFEDLPQDQGEEDQQDEDLFAAGEADDELLAFDEQSQEIESEQMDPDEIELESVEAGEDDDLELPQNDLEAAREEQTGDDLAELDALIAGLEEEIEEPGESADVQEKDPMLLMDQDFSLDDESPEDSELPENLVKAGFETDTSAPAGPVQENETGTEMDADKGSLAETVKQDVLQIFEEKVSSLQQSFEKQQSDLLNKLEEITQENEKLRQLLDSKEEELKGSLLAEMKKEIPRQAADVIREEIAAMTEELS
ncbi:MAG: hypothetical protein ACOC0U_05485, partial [Desulfovibrionales bacterium]